MLNHDDIILNSDLICIKSIAFANKNSIWSIQAIKETYKPYSYKISIACFEDFEYNNLQYNMTLDFLELNNHFDKRKTIDQYQRIVDIFAINDFEKELFSRKDNKVKKDKVTREKVKKVIQSETPLSFETIDLMVALTGSYDAVVEINDIAIKYNKNPLQLAEFLSK